MSHHSFIDFIREYKDLRFMLNVVYADVQVTSFPQGPLTALRSADSLLFISVCLFLAAYNTNYTTKTQPLPPNEKKQGRVQNPELPPGIHSSPLADPSPLPVGVGRPPSLSEPGPSRTGSNPASRGIHHSEPLHTSDDDMSTTSPPPSNAHTHKNTPGLILAWA